MLAVSKRARRRSDKYITTFPSEVSHVCHQPAGVASSVALREAGMGETSACPTSMAAPLALPLAVLEALGEA